MSMWKLPTLGLILTLATPIDASENGWRMLHLATVEEHMTATSYRAEKTFPPELREATANFEIEGYYVPVEAQPYVQSFLLVEDPAGCPFCGGAGYSPVLEVRTSRPIADRPEASRIRVVGTLKLIDDPETLMMFELVDAREVPAGS